MRAATLFPSERYRASLWPLPLINMKSFSCLSNYYVQMSKTKQAKANFPHVEPCSKK